MQCSCYPEAPIASAAAFSKARLHCLFGVLSVRPSLIDPSLIVVRQAGMLVVVVVVVVVIMLVLVLELSLAWSGVALVP